MNIAYGLITYNRLDYLKKHIITWNKTRNKNHNWTLIIADDGSDDGSKKFIKNIKIDNIKIKTFFNKRRGVHYQTNQIFKYCKDIDFSIGFMAQDDIYFVYSGWDNLYINAVKKSGFEHLCYFNKQWAIDNSKKQHINDDCLRNKQKKIQSNVSGFNAFGVFWTFTLNVINAVGFFDLENFSLCGNGHTDYTIRCCKAKFNNRKFLYDAFNSNKYIAMQNNNYKRALRKKNRINAAFIGLSDKGHKGRIIERSTRVYIHYNEIPFNMLGEKIE